VSSASSGRLTGEMGRAMPCGLLPILGRGVALCEGKGGLGFPVSKKSDEVSPGQRVDQDFFLFFGEGG